MTGLLKVLIGAGLSCLFVLWISLLTAIFIYQGLALWYGVSASLVGTSLLVLCYLIGDSLL